MTIDILSVVNYKKKYLKIMRYFGKWPIIKDKLLLKLRDEIDYNWAFVINTKSNTDLCDLYEKINLSIEKSYV